MTICRRWTNSDLRRGRPTLHKAYDDATAILAGDALLTLAFDIISRDEIHREASVRLLLTRALARASGVGGMVGGQILDLAARAASATANSVDVARLQQMKTGALLHYGCIAGAILGQSSQRNIRRSTITAAHSAKPSRSPTICSMWRATRRRSAKDRTGTPH